MITNTANVPIHVSVLHSYLTVPVLWSILRHAVPFSFITMSLNLSNLGSELDSIRRARRGDPAPTPASSGYAEPIPIYREPTAGADAASVGGTSFSSTASLSPASVTRPLDPAPDAPSNLCLLCFARHPSAVLLPCKPACTSPTTPGAPSSHLPLMALPVI